MKIGDISYFHFFHLNLIIYSYNLCIHIQDDKNSDIDLTVVLDGFKGILQFIYWEV